MAKLFKRGDVWYAWVPKPGGGVERKTTLCTDRKAALLVAAQLERGAVDPHYAAQNEAATEGLLSAYLASRVRLGRAEGTIHHVRTKAGHLRRLLPARAAEITHARVEAYVDTRLAEGAARTTVKKELRVLKATLQLAAKNKLFLEVPANVIPELEDDYEPRTRYLTPWELVALVHQLGEDDPRAAMVAFIVATGARLGEARRAQRSDVSERGGVAFVAIRGTKTKRSRAEVPVVGVGATLLAWAIERVPRTGPAFPRWASVGRDLAAACRRAGIPRCSPNDLRRTMATWLQQAGAGNDLVAKAMRHVDGRMVERVYGRMTPDDLARLIAKRTSEGSPGSGAVSAEGVRLPERASGDRPSLPGGGSEEPGSISGPRAPAEEDQGAVAGAVAVSEAGVFLAPVRWVDRDDLLAEYPARQHDGRELLMGDDQAHLSVTGTHQATPNREDSPENSCPGTESNRRHGDFQADTPEATEWLENKLRERALGPTLEVSCAANGGRFRAAARYLVSEWAPTLEAA